MSSSVAKSSKLKPINIFWNNDVDVQQSLPDAAQVLIILEELGLPYQSRFVDFDAPEKPSKGEREFLKASPAGILPAISDPNNDDFALFDSGPIVSYLVARYDTAHALSYESSLEALKLQQWMHLQASRHRACLVAAASTRDEIFYREVRRRVGRLDYHLVGVKWLYGDKCTYADLAFVVWNERIPFILKGSSKGWESLDYPYFRPWQNAMMARKSVRRVLSVMGNREVQSDGTT